MPENPKPEYKAAKLSAVGLIGFLFGFIVMQYDNFFNHCTPSDRIFHEVGYNAGALVRDAVVFWIDSLQKDIVRIRSTKTSKDTGAALLNSLAQKDTLTILSLQQKAIFYDEVGANDSLSWARFNPLVHLDISPTDLSEWDRQFEKHGYAWTTGVPCWIRMADLNPVLTHSTTAQVSIRHDIKTIGFIAKYPESGTFLLLIAIFCSFCAIALVTSIVSAKQISRNIHCDDDPEASLIPFFVGWMIIGTVLAILVSTIRHSFNDEIYAKGLFFRRHLRTSLTIVSGLGYLAGSCCLAGFTYTASMLSFFHKRVRDIKWKLRDPNLTDKDKDDLSVQQVYLQQKYTWLLGFFNKYFMLSAVILSLQVFCTGALFSTVNSLGFVKLLSSNWGYTPARGDIVYLYGAFFTIILLLIYFPARIRFNDISLELPTPASSTATPAPDDRKIDLFKDPFSFFKGTLLASSPLLIGVVQSLLDLLFKN